MHVLDLRIFTNTHMHNFNIYRIKLNFNKLYLRCKIKILNWFCLHLLKFKTIITYVLMLYKNNNSNKKKCCTHSFSKILFFKYVFHKICLRYKIKVLNIFCLHLLKYVLLLYKKIIQTKLFLFIYFLKFFEFKILFFFY